MSNNFVPKLTGGILFSLILRERKQRYSKTENTEGKSDGLSDKDVLQALLEIANPYITMPKGDSPKTHASNFKKCECSKTSWFPLLSNDFIEMFNYQLKENYTETLIRVNNLVSNYLNKGQMNINRLGRSILDLIARDKSIPDDAEFFIKNGAESVKKIDMLPNNKYELQPLILGVWYYLINNKIDNSEGAETFQYMHTSSGEHGVYDINFDISNSQYNETLIIALSDNDSRFDIEEQKTTIIPEIPYDFTDYLNRIENKYKDVKTFLYKNSPKYFYDFYVCNDIMPRTEAYYISGLDREFYEGRHRNVSNATMYDLYSKFGNFLLITANGGMGKSMMMRHLLLDSIINFSSNKLVPLFISLKDYPDNCDNLLDFVFDNVYNHDITMEQLKFILSNGNALVLLDGLDEIKNHLVAKFEHQLEAFTDRYSTSVFVMSSRPYKDFSVHTRFRELQLMSLSKTQAVELINKLKFRDDDPSIKAGFLNLLKRKLFRSHRDFVSNPLLLTIMLVTFEYYRDIPSKMHKFYHDAYEALAWKHDTAKTSFKREWNTNLKQDGFADFLAEFCFRTYYKEKFEFTYEEGKEFFNDLKIAKKFTDSPVEYRAFIDDLAHNMCLIYFESGKYHFTHRSFQEYFCARYLAKQKDSILENIGKMFDKKSRRQYSDQTFSMLYGMIPEKVEQYIFIPFLESLIKECENNERLITYIKNVYPKLTYISGTVDGFVFYDNHPRSYLLSFIKSVNKMSDDLEFDDLLKDVEVREEFVEEWFCTATVDIDDDGNTEEIIVSGRQFKDDYDEDGDEIEKIGWILSLDNKIIFDKKDEYKDIIELITSNESPYFEEYEEIKILLKKYKDKYADDDESDDLYDLI